MFQVIFNEISAADISQLDTLSQLELLDEFQVSPKDLENLDQDDDNTPFGVIEREGKTMYRYRAQDLRIYFEVTDSNEGIIVQRVLNRNTFTDFLFRATNLSMEDSILGESKHFWELIDEGASAPRV